MPPATDVASVADVTAVEDHTGANMTVTPDRLHTDPAAINCYLSRNRTETIDSFYSRSHV